MFTETTPRSKAVAETKDLGPFNLPIFKNEGNNGGWFETIIIPKGHPIIAEIITAWNTRPATDAAVLREALQYCADAPLSGWTIAQAVAGAALAQADGAKS